MRAFPALALLGAALAVAACGNTYHPEYHPVTTTSYEQHVTMPYGAQGGAPPPGPVFAAPPPAQPPTPAPWSAWPDQ